MACPTKLTLFNCGKLAEEKYPEGTYVVRFPLAPVDMEASDPRFESSSVRMLAAMGASMVWRSSVTIPPRFDKDKDFAADKGVQNPDGNPVKPVEVVPGAP